MVEPHKEEIVRKTCMLLVSHFRNLGEYGDLGFNTRLFSHMLHPESHFVNAGTSQSIKAGTPTHPEHVVPCATLITECKRMIREGYPFGRNHSVSIAAALESCNDFQGRARAP